MMQNNSTIIQTQAKLPVAPLKGAQLAISGQNQRDQPLLKKPLIGLKALADKALENHTENYFCQIAPKKTSNFLPQKTSKKLRPEKPYFGLELIQLKTLAADDWDEVKDNPAMLKAIVETYIMLKGLDPEVPSTIYTKTIHCQNCGEIKTWASFVYDTVPCCQWCLVNNDLIWNK